MGPRADWTPGSAFEDVPAARLWAGDLCVDHADDTLTIALTLEWDASPDQPHPPSGQQLRVEITDLDRLGGDRRNLLAAHAPPNATALVPLLAVIAATSCADLTIDAPVCPTALAGARRALAAGQLNHGWPAVTLGATAGATSPLNRSGEGLVFSLGAEALATLVALQRADRGPTHLVAIDGLADATRTPGGNAAAAGLASGDDGCRRWRAEAMAANAARLPLVRASTNARTFLLSQAACATSRQAVAASCALALAGVVGSVVVPSSVPGTTDLWSSDAVAINEARAASTTAEASALVASDPWARQWLQVCPVGRGEGNCGVCRPCQLALATLWLAGASRYDLPSFAHAADPALVRALDPTPLADRADCLAVIDGLHRVADGDDQGRVTTSTDDRLLAAALADAWAAHLRHAGATRPAPALSA